MRSLTTAPYPPPNSALLTSLIEHRSAYRQECHGPPIGPFESPEMIAAVVKGFDTLLGQLQPIPSREAPPAEASLWGKETVCALGASNRENAELYGHMTGRQVCVSPSLRDALAQANPTVLVATWDQLRVAELDLLHSFSIRSRPVGLLVGNSPEQLRLRLLISGALVHGSRTATALPALPASAIIGRGTGEMAAELFDRVSDAEADRETVLRVLSGPSSVLGFIGHSDGVDARLSNRATLCARVETGTVDLHRRPANCDTTGYCHRRQMARVDALASNALLSPSTVAARVVLMMSCYVASPVDCSVHPAHGLLSQLLHNPMVGAIIAPWEVAYPYVEELLQLARPLLRGSTIGEALTGFFRSAPGTLRGCNRYLLFGDPAVRATSPPTFSAHQEDDRTRLFGTTGAVPPPPAVQKIAGRRRIAKTTPVDWLQARLDRIAAEPLRTATGQLRVSDEALARARQAVADVRLPGKKSDSYEALLRVVLAFEGSTFVHWLEEGLGLPEFVDRRTSCFGCGAQGRLFRLESRFSVRWLACCTQCASFYADTPEGSELIDGNFAVDPHSAIRHSLPALRDGAILLNLRSSLETRTTWRLDQPFDFSALPPGRSWLWLHALSDEGMVSYSRMIDNRPVRKEARDDP